MNPSTMTKTTSMDITTHNRSMVDADDRASHKLTGSFSNLRGKESCYFGGNAEEPVGEKVEAKCPAEAKKKGQTTTRRLIKSLSNKSLRNLAAGVRKMSNGKVMENDGGALGAAGEDTSTAAAKCSGAKQGARAPYRPRSDTLETLQKQAREEGLQFRPRPVHPLLD